MFLWDYFDWCQLFFLFRSNFFQSNKYLKASYLLTVNFTPRPFELKVQNTTLEIDTGSICSSPAACFEKCHLKPSLLLLLYIFFFKSASGHYSQQNLLSHFLPQKLSYGHHYLLKICRPLITWWLITAQALALLSLFLGWTGGLCSHHSPFLPQPHVCSFFSSGT